jgi:pimeloyl-ACP methyl ester carboxylesterase
MLKHPIIIVLFSVLALAACSSETQSGDLTGDSPPIFQSEYFETTVTGDGPNVILVPGLASSAAVWDETIIALQDDYRVHALQVAGFAGAPVRGNAENTDILQDLATDISRYTQGLDGETSVIGHSLGGLVTLKTALISESKIDRIMIIDVLPYFSVLMDAQATPETIAPIAAFMKSTLLNQSDEVFAARQDEALAALVKSPDDRQKALEWSVASDRAVMAQAMSEVLVTDLRGEIAAIKIPTTIIFADDPTIPNIDTVRDYYAADYAPIENAKLIPIKDALHFIMYDQPEALQAEISVFLKGD